MTEKTVYVIKCGGSYLTSAGWSPEGTWSFQEDVMKAIHFNQLDIAESVKMDDETIYILRITVLERELI